MTAELLKFSDGVSLSPGFAAPAWLDRQAYPFQSRELALSQGRIHYVDEGQGEPIVFVHGTPSWSFEFRHLLRGLAATHRCIALDLLGFGLSERPRDFAYTPEAHARVVEEFLLRLNLPRFTLVVHDFGGPIALPFAERYPERVARLVVLNSFMWPLDEDRELRRSARFAASFLGRALYRLLNASLRWLMPYAYGDRRRLTPAIHAQYLAPFRATPDARVRVLWQLAQALLGSRSHYAALWAERARLAPIPALVIWGMADRALPPRLLPRWLEALPQARAIQLARAGHWPQEEEPERVLAEISAFLRAER
jgi:haloalkane dehalogenase